LLCKRIIFANSKEVKTGYNLAELLRKAMAQKGAVLAMMMMIYFQTVTF
jgi:hypothetical protein